MTARRLRPRAFSLTQIALNAIDPWGSASARLRADAGARRLLNGRLLAVTHDFLRDFNAAHDLRPRSAAIERSLPPADRDDEGEGQ